MSTLGHDIRAQQTVAECMAADLSTSASVLRTQIAATDWVSTAADQCRARLGAFAREIDARSEACRELVHAIEAHASCVEVAEVTAAIVPASSLPEVSAPRPPSPTCSATPPRSGAPAVIGLFPLTAGAAR